EFSALIPFLPKQTAARKNFRSVDLDVAWQEWQIAMNARMAVYRVLGLNAEVSQALEATEGLQQSTDAMRKAVEAHETVLDLAAVESASQDSRATMLSLQQELEKQRLGLNKILGVEPDVKVALHSGLSLPSRLGPPAQHDLSDNLEWRRLDLLGLQHELESQDATVRAAILAQLPKMSAGFVKASDTTNVHTTGFIVAVDVPIFDRNQGVIANERATRQRLRDEYNQRVFEARSDIATAIADIRSLDRQIAAAEEALPLLEKLVTSAQTAVEQGNADVLAYYTARSNLLQKRIQLVKLKEHLIEIELSPAAQVQFQQAKNAAEAARKELKQTQERFNLKLATNQDLSAAEKTARDAEAQLTALQRAGAGGDNRIHSDMSGIIA